MTKLFLSLMIISISILMFFLKTPLSMGFSILLQTILTCLLSGMLIKTYWFSYILFLTFIGGLLVLFIYISSIASNELFNINIITKLFIILCIILILFMQYFFMNNLMWMNLSNNSDMNNFFYYMNMINNENKFNLSKLYNNQTFLLMMMLIIYLFITLIAVVKITNIFYGPIRASI
nr:NADH dehydrogenase subunit 6 [Spatalia doerriesi]